MLALYTGLQLLFGCTGTLGDGDTGPAALGAPVEELDAGHEASGLGRCAGGSADVSAG